MTVSRTLPRVVSSRPTKKPSWRRRAVLWSLRLMLGLFVGSVLVVLALRFIDPPTSAFMLQRQYEASRKNERLTIRQQWVPLARMSQNVQLAFIAAEDQNFPTHHGFDVKAIEDAIDDHLEGKSSRGASTLSQQVAKNLFLWNGHSYLRKALEAYFTVLIEACWPKHRILEMHLNLAELGNGLYGVEAASRVYFGHPAAQLTLDESALLAAVLPNPKVRRVTAPSPMVAQRAGWITDQARRLGLDTLHGL